MTDPEKDVLLDLARKSSADTARSWQAYQSMIAQMMALLKESRANAAAGFRDIESLLRSGQKEDALLSATELAQAFEADVAESEGTI